MDEKTENKINELFERGVENIYPSRDFLFSALKSGKKLRIYLGVDPTGPTLHLGHAIPLKKLSQFQDLGHHIILLMGDFTARIGDPTGKSSARKVLSEQEVKENMKLYKQQASKIIKFDGPNPAEIKFNSEWLQKLNFADLAGLASHLTFSQTIKRSMFQERTKKGQDIFLSEFLYPLMQGYDSIALDVDGEIGGNDQMFNMLVGRDLMKKISHKEKFVITTKILVDNKGQKMGKTEGNMVTLKDSPEEMFGKIMSWDDSLILPGFELCTNVSLRDIEKIKSELADTKTNPKSLKEALAFEIVKIYHSTESAQAARDEFAAAFQKKEVPENIKEVAVLSGQELVEILLKNGLVKSKSEFRRLIVGGGLHDLEKNAAITDPYFKITAALVLKIGKKTFIKIIPA